MSTSVDILTKEQQHKQHLTDAVSDACSIQPALPKLQLEAHPQDGKAPAVANTLTLRKRNSEFAMASYNSAFLEGLFDDIASSNSTVVPSEKEETIPAPTVDGSDPTEASPVSVLSDHNLSKRRRVSTNKSLGRCEQSVANLASCSHLASVADIASPRKAVTKKSSVLISSKAAPTKAKSKKDLPATVSASYSFHLDLALQEQDRPGKEKSEKNQQGDFGWFIDTDDQEDLASCQSGLSGSCHTPAAPLAFSAPTAPRAPSHDLQAEVEWAQAADTVDEVLGDLF